MCRAMDETTRQEFKDRILDEIAETEERIMRLEKATEVVAPDKALGRLSRLEAMSDKGVNGAALFQARERLEKMEIALTRVFQSSFGRCHTQTNALPVLQGDNRSGSDYGFNWVPLIDQKLWTSAWVLYGGGIGIDS